MRPLTHIVVHHSASPRRTTKLADIRRWHVEERGWDDVGYSYVIEGDGRLRQGRPLDVPGAHVRGHNEDTIGVCLVGDNTVFGEEWGPAQLVTLRELVAALRLLHGPLEVVGHRDLAPGGTACPGLDVRGIV